MHTPHHTPNSRSNIPGYPDNLASVTETPDVPWLIPRIAIFTVLLFVIFIGWHHMHNVIAQKQAQLSGIYTLAFFSNDADSRDAQDQALLAQERLQQLHMITDVSVIDNTTIPAFENAPLETLPALLHIKIDAQQAERFQSQLSDILATFPTALLRDHSQDARLSTFTAQNKSFLRVLDISTLLSIALLLTTLFIALQRWLAPYERTIALLRILGAEDKTILYVFGQQIDKKIIKALAFTAGLTVLGALLPMFLLTGLGIMPKIVLLKPLIILPLVFIGTGIIYMVTKLRTQNVLQQQLIDIA